MRPAAFAIQGDVSESSEGKLAGMKLQIKLRSFGICNCRTFDYFSSHLGGLSRTKLDLEAGSTLTITCFEERALKQSWVSDKFVGQRHSEDHPV